MAFRQTRIFVPSAEATDHWYPTSVGKVIAPLFADNVVPKPEWFWFSHYNGGLGDTADCDLDQIPDNYKLPLVAGGQPELRTVRFRFKIPNVDRAAFEQALNTRIAECGYAHSGCLDYDHVADLASNRLLGDIPGRDARAEQRAELVARFYQSISKLVIDMLVPIAGDRFRLENTHDLIENPTGKTFDTLGHLYGNISGCDLPITVFRKTVADQPDQWLVFGHVYGSSLNAALLADGWTLAVAQPAKI